MKTETVKKIMPFVIVVVTLTIGVIAYTKLIETTSLPLPTASPSPVVSTQSIEPFNIVEYNSTNDILHNPYRGFYHHTETHSSNYQPLTLSELQSYRTEDNTTVILRVYYLEDFVNSPISDEYLLNIRKDMDTIREAGFTVVVRFAYTSNVTPPYGDASKEIVQNHIKQLTPIFQEYGDIIKVVQAGFIGAWGEWYYTDYFVQDSSSPSEISAKDYQNRSDVVLELLSALPKDSFVQVRTPNYKINIFPNENLNSSNAYSGTNVARIGFHNDCFLASPDDYGTFQDETERDYLSSETLFSPMGGETCNPNPPRSSCPTTLEELASFHWSFINIDYHPDVINNWVAEGCFNEIENRLGYRYVLQRAGFSNQVLQGGKLRLEIELKNVGWAGIFAKTDVEFVIRNSENQKEYSFVVSDDPRNWLPSDTSYTISHSLCMPKDIETGMYELLLRLSPPDSKNKPVYSVQFANELIWEQDKGLNNLGHIFEIIEGISLTECKNE